MKHTPRAGDFVQPDGWSQGASIYAEESGFTDSSWPGCQFRLPTNHPAPLDYHLGINLVVTGRPHTWPYMDGRFRSRCRIEFVGDGEPSTFTGGWIYHSI